MGQILAIFLIAMALSGPGVMENGKNLPLGKPETKELVCQHEMWVPVGEEEIQYIDISDSLHGKRIVRKMRCVNPACAHEATIILEEAYERHEWVNQGDCHGLSSAFSHDFWDACAKCDRETSYSLFCGIRICDELREKVILGQKKEPPRPGLEKEPLPAHQ